MVTKTGNLLLAQPAYNSVGWDVHFNGNMAIIDAALSQFFVQANFLGTWENSTAYDINDVVVDSTNSNIYTCAVGHTSPASPTTFSAHRTANPSYWTNTTNVAAAGRGTWATATAYVKGDFVVSGTVYAVCTTNHTSGATFAGDAAYWSELIDVSSAAVADGSINNAKFASPLTIPGATTIAAGGLTVTAGGITVTAGGLSVVAGATNLQGTTIQSGGLTVTAGGIGVTAGGINIALGGLIVQAGGITVTGNSTLAGTLSGLTGLTVASGGVTVTTGGLTVAANGITVTGNSTITGTLGGLTGLTVASGGVTVTSGGATITAGGLTITAGGATIGGNSTVTGTFAATSTVSGTAFIPTAATVPTNGLFLVDTNSVALATNTTERARFNASGALGIAGANYGTAGQVLVSAGNAAPPAWGAVESSRTTIASGSLSGTDVSITSIAATYNRLVLVLRGATCSSTTRDIQIDFSVNNGGLYTQVYNPTSGGGSSGAVDLDMTIFDYHGGSKVHTITTSTNGTNGDETGIIGAYAAGADNVDAINIGWDGAGNFTAGTYVLYGYR